MRRHEAMRHDRVRVARRFGWIEHDLVFRGFLVKMTPEGSCLYLFLCVVANRNGVSWHSDEGIRKQTGLSQEDLATARAELVTLDLVAFESPYFQVLALPPQKASAPAPATPPPSAGATAEDVNEAVAAIQRRLLGGERC